MFSCKFAGYFQNTFSKEHLWRVASAINSSKNNNTSFLNKSVNDSLKDLHGRYATISIVKANGNAALICKKHFSLILFRKIATTNFQSTYTYEYCKNINHIMTPCLKTFNDLKKRHISYIRNQPKLD